MNPGNSGNFCPAIFNDTLIVTGAETGDRSNLPERPEGCCAQIGPVPFFGALFGGKGKGNDVLDVGDLDGDVDSLTGGQGIDRAQGKKELIDQLLDVIETDGRIA